MIRRVDRYWNEMKPQQLAFELGAPNCERKLS